MMWSFVTFLVSLPMCTLVGLGEGLRLLRSFSSRLGGLDLERDRRLLSWRRREGLGEPEELLELELRDVLELPERLDAEDELEPLLEPVLVLEPELEVELDRDLEGNGGNNASGRVVRDPEASCKFLRSPHSRPTWCCYCHWTHCAASASCPCLDPCRPTPWWPLCLWSGPWTSPRSGPCVLLEKEP